MRTSTWLAEREAATLEAEDFTCCVHLGKGSLKQRNMLRVPSSIVIARDQAWRASTSAKHQPLACGTLYKSGDARAVWACQPSYGNNPTKVHMRSWLGWLVKAASTWPEGDALQPWVGDLIKHIKTHIKNIQKHVKIHLKHINSILKAHKKQIKNI